jgi:hypothetical protein
LFYFSITFLISFELKKSFYFLRTLRSAAASVAAEWRRTSSPAAEAAVEVVVQRRSASLPPLSTSTMVAMGWQESSNNTKINYIYIFFF